MENACLPQKTAGALFLFAPLSVCRLRRVAGEKKKKTRKTTIIIMMAVRGMVIIVSQICNSGTGAISSVRAVRFGGLCSHDYLINGGRKRECICSAAKGGGKGWQGGEFFTLGRKVPPLLSG
jgi:hypothetical protein